MSLVAYSQSLEERMIALKKEAVEDEGALYATAGELVSKIPMMLSEDEIKNALLKLHSMIPGVSLSGVLEKLIDTQLEVSKLESKQSLVRLNIIDLRDTINNIGRNIATRKCRVCQRDISGICYQNTKQRGYTCESCTPQEEK